MRLWSLHPHYLDAKGLVALWREALLAQAVLSGKTKGYKNHPQLLRFKAQRNPIKAIGFYLSLVEKEAAARGYHFDSSKIISPCARLSKQISLQRGQLAYEWEHLKRKLKTRDPVRLKSFKKESQIRSHPLFQIVAGGVEEWEKM